MTDSRVLGCRGPGGLVRFAARLAVGRPYTPGDELRSAMLEACRADVLRDVQGDARNLGFGGGADATLDEESATFVQEGKDRVRIEGRGAFRFGREYLPQPMTFSCEWEAARERLPRQLSAREADITALPPERAGAASACAAAVRAEFTTMARRRMYPLPIHSRRCWRKAGYR